jgi:hypothetical protein
VAEPATEDLTPTVRAVADELGHDPVTAQQLTEAILRHHSDYGGGRDIQWPATPRVVPLERWLDDARAAFTKEAHGSLHGRIAILGAGLADPSAGRAMARAGLFHALGQELSPPLWAPAGRGDRGLRDARGRGGRRRRAGREVRATDPATLFRDDPPIAPYRAILFLLALCTGAPHAAAGFLDAAIDSRPGRVAELIAGEGEERGRIDAWLADDASVRWRGLDAVDLRPWAAEVVRFTFHWHAQSKYS